MNRLRALEARLNRRLRGINAAYRVSNLIENGKGTYSFDLSVEFDPTDVPRVKAVFADILGRIADRDRARTGKRDLQKKYYLKKETAERAQRYAKKQGLSESELVEMVLEKELKKGTAK